MSFEIHASIKERLNYFYEIHKIPNLIFHGPSGSGKRTLVRDFISKIYNGDKEKIHTFTLHVNCSHGKGIKFIREELKFFAKTNIHSNCGNNFKSIVLFNADKLTMDAQSALRRCIELFSHNTRFFIVAEDKYKLMKPILSRFCEIHIPEPTVNGKPVNLYKYNIDETFHLKDMKRQRLDNLRRELQKKSSQLSDVYSIMQMSLKLVEKGYSALDILQLLECPTFLASIMSPERRVEMLVCFHRVKIEFRNEKLLIFFILHFVFVSSNFSLENISFI